MRKRIVLSFQLSRQERRGPGDDKGRTGETANHFDLLPNELRPGQILPADLAAAREAA
jgi:hypothetical protein